MKRFLSFTNLAVTLFIFFFMWGFGKVGVQFEFLNVFEQVFENFELTDVYYSKFRKDEDVKFEERIVLVNIGDLPRRGIAQQIAILNQYNPKVIGIDAFFTHYKEDTLGDQFLAEVIKDAENFVLVSGLHGFDSATNTWADNTTITKTLDNTVPLFRDLATTGFANTVTEEGGNEAFNTWKKVRAKQKLKNGKMIPSFAAQITSFYDAEATKDFLEKGEREQHIYFKGNVTDNVNGTATKYYLLEYDQVLNQEFDPTLIEGKIVLMGYMGGEYTSTSWDTDKFYTPLNKNSVGRGYPDMYGVVIHANIISMILNRKFIDNMHSYFGILLAFIVCYLNVTLFVSILKKPRLAPWYGALSKGIQLVEVIILFGLIFFLFAGYLYRADLTLTFLAVLLSGDLSEIFMDIIGNVFSKEKIKH
jgi:CHASE2 domain-containing sensor protein